MTLLFKPMKAYRETPDLDKIQYPVLASPKLDGIRSVQADGIAWSNSMKRIPNGFVQHVLNELELHGLDGELMVRGGFENVQSAIMSQGGEPDFFFNVFDDWSLSAGFVRRHEQAKERIADLNSEYVKVVEHHKVANKEELQVLWDKWIAEGYEGAMVRAVMGPYKQGRSTLREGYLLKLKKWIDDEGIIVGYEEQMHNDNPAYTGELGQTKRSHSKVGMVPAGCLGKFILKWQDKEVKVGSGLTQEQRNRYWMNREDLFGHRVTFKYQELTRAGQPRFPIFKGIRHD